MKKILLLLACLLLCGCQAKPETEGENKTDGKPSGSLQYVNASTGFTTEDGYYHIVDNDDGEGNIYSNIRYYDFKSKKEIYLCDKPDCLHHDANCTAYVDAHFAQSFVFAADNHLYLVINDNSAVYMNMGEEAKNNTKTGAIIYEMDLDGKNRKELFTLKDGYQFEPSNLVLQGSYAYFVIAKDDSVMLDDHTQMGITLERSLIRINLKHGSEKNVLDMKNRYLLDASGHQMLFSSLHYAQDIEELLKNKDYATYDAVIQQAKSNLVVFDVNSNTLGKEFSIQNEIPVLKQDEVYYINAANQLCRQHLQDETPEVLAQLDNGYTYTIASTSEMLEDGYVLIEAWEQAPVNADYVMSKVYDIKDQALRDFTLTLKNPTQAMRVLGICKDQYFMVYKQDAHMETTWAGTQQLAIDKEYYGLIDKDDFWQCKEAFQPIASLAK